MALARGPTDATEILARLWLGSGKSSKDREGLERAGIKTIINCAGKQFYPGSFEYYRCFFKDDDSTPDACEAFRTAVLSTWDFLGLREGTKSEVKECTLLHCVGGISRSAAVCVALVMRVRDIPSLEALEFVQVRVSPTVSHTEADFWLSPGSPKTCPRSQRVPRRTPRSGRGAG
jgi:Dual specificity phosphatase, catalytic domain